jgi:HK97 family phage prohead protease
MSKARKIGRILPGDTTQQKIAEGLALQEKGEGVVLIRTAPDLGEAGEARVAKDIQRAFWIRGSDETVDRLGDVLRAKGWDTSHFKKNPIVPWAHQYRDLPVGKALRVVRDMSEKALDFLIQCTPEGMHEFNDKVHDFFVAKFLRGSSVGFKPLEWKDRKEGDKWLGYEFTKQQLWELSLCPLPANPNALAKMSTAGLALVPSILPVVFLDGKTLKEEGHEQEKWFVPRRSFQEAIDFFGKTECEEEVRQPQAPPEETDDTDDGKPKARWFKISNGVNALKITADMLRHPDAKQERLPLDEGRGVYLDLFGTKSGGITLIHYFVYDMEKWATKEDAMAHAGEFFAGYDYVDQELVERMRKRQAVMHDLCGKAPTSLPKKDAEPPETRPEETDDFIHIPVRDKGQFVDGSFKTVDISKSKGIKSVMGKLKNPPEGQAGSMVVQKFLFAKAKGWTMQKAKDWVKEHSKIISYEANFAAAVAFENGWEDEQEQAWYVGALFEFLDKGFGDNHLAAAMGLFLPEVPQELIAELDTELYEKLDTISEKIDELDRTVTLALSLKEEEPETETKDNEDDGDEPQMAKERVVRLTDGRKPEATEGAKTKVRELVQQIVRETVGEEAQTRLEYHRGKVKKR